MRREFGKERVKEPCGETSVNMQEPYKPLRGLCDDGRERYGAQEIQLRLNDRLANRCVDAVDRRGPWRGKAREEHVEQVMVLAAVGGTPR